MFQSKDVKEIVDRLEKFRGQHSDFFRIIDQFLDRLRHLDHSAEFEIRRIQSNISKLDLGVNRIIPDISDKALESVIAFGHQTQSTTTKLELIRNERLGILIVLRPVADNLEQTGKPF